ncbi:MAG: GxxExxY protein [bacterium]
MEKKLPDNDRAELIGTELIGTKLTGVVIGAFYETYNVLGFGFLEQVYKNALAIELKGRGLHVQTEMPIEVRYKDQRAGWYRLDILVERRLAVEVKASEFSHPNDRKQMLNYLRATDLDVGLLLHYGVEPDFKRCVSPRVTDQATRPQTGSSKKS